MTRNVGTPPSQRQVTSDRESSESCGRKPTRTAEADVSRSVNRQPGRGFTVRSAGRSPWQDTVTEPWVVVRDSTIVRGVADPAGAGALGVADAVGLPLDCPGPGPLLPDALGLVGWLGVGTGETNARVGVGDTPAGDCAGLPAVAAGVGAGPALVEAAVAPDNGPDAPGPAAW